MDISTMVLGWPTSLMVRASILGLVAADMKETLLTGWHMVTALTIGQMVGLTMDSGSTMRSMEKAALPTLRVKLSSVSGKMVR